MTVFAPAVIAKISLIRNSITRALRSVHTRDIAPCAASISRAVTPNEPRRSSRGTRKARNRCRGQEKAAGHFARDGLIRCRDVESCRTENRDQSKTRRRFSRMVSAGGARRRVGGTERCARVHGDSALGLRRLGEYATSARRDVSRYRTPQCLLSAFHSTQLFREGS